METDRAGGVEIETQIDVSRSVATDPAHFVAGLSQVAAGVRAESLGAEDFRAEVYAAPMRNTGLFSVRIRDARVERGPQPYTAITVPVSRPLDFARRSKQTTFYPGSAHILHTVDDLDLQIDQPSGLFVATFEKEWIDASASRLTQHRHYHDVHSDWSLDLESATGRSFRHFLDFIWQEICSGAQFTRSELAIREIENTCVTLLVLASEARLDATAEESKASGDKKPVEIAEEYLRANLTEPYSLDKTHRDHRVERQHTVAGVSETPRHASAPVLEDSPSRGRPT